MVGLETPPFIDTENGGELGGAEMGLACAPYRDLLWRADMIEAGQMQFSLTESLELPGVLIDAIEYVQFYKAKIAEESIGPR
jgi:hypothetical protein